MADLKVGVKFCGKCNPDIDTGEIYRQIMKLVPANVKFVSKDTPDKQLLLVISGCPADCAGRPGGEHRELVIAGTTIDYHPIPEKNIPGKVAAKLKSLTWL